MEAAPNRRRFLAVAATGLVAAISGLILTPVVAFVTSPLRKRTASEKAGDEFSDAGPIEAIPKDQWTLRPIEIVRQDGWVKTHQSRSVWVFVKSPNSREIRVLSPICPHLGCPVGWNSMAAEFRCPCHGGTFSPTGVHLGGPPPRGMDPLQFEVREERLWVRWQDFRMSVPDRVAVQV